MFFTYLNQIMSPGVDYNLTISQTTTGDLTVIVLPKVHGLKDEAQHLIGPLQLKGSPQELDRGFFPSITAPIQKTSGLLVNMAEYERQQDAAAAESKSAKEQKDKISKEAKEKREKYDGFMKKAEEMEAAGNLDGALLQFQQARLHATDKAAKTVDQKIAAIKAKMGEGTLFGAAQPAITPAVPQLKPMSNPATVDSEPAAVPEQPVPQPAVAQPAPAPIPEAQSMAAAPAPDPTRHPAEPAPTSGHTPVYNPRTAPMFGNEQSSTPTPVFATEPATGSGFGIFGAPTSPPAQSGQPVWGVPVYRENEYAGFDDFPSEMLPPMSHGIAGLSA